MKVGQRIESAREIKEERDTGVVIVGKGIKGTVTKFISDNVEIEFDGPYVLRNDKKNEAMGGKVRVSFEVIKAKNYLG